MGLPFERCMLASGLQPCGQLPSAVVPGKVEDRFLAHPSDHMPTPGEGPHAVADVAPHLRLGVRQWLQGLDESGFLVQYHDQIVGSFGSLAQIHEMYVKDG